MLQTLETRSAEDGAARFQALADPFDRRPSAEREAAEVELAKAEISDQPAQVPGEDSDGIMFGFVRLATEPVAAKVGHDRPEALRRDPLGVTQPHPGD